MERDAHYAAVGIATVALAAALIIFSIWLARLSFNEEYDLYDIVFYGPVRGLSEGGEVHFNGIRVGIVTDLRLDPEKGDQVVARIRAVTRRAIAASPASDRPKNYSFTLDDLRVVPDELRAYRDEQSSDLSLRDIAILELLHHNRGRVIDRDTFFDECWGTDYYPASRTLDQHISQLRKRIEKDPANPVIICTVHGAGYRFDG